MSYADELRARHTIFPSPRTIIYIEQSQLPSKFWKHNLDLKKFSTTPKETKWRTQVGLFEKRLSSKSFFGAVPFNC